MCCCFSSSLHSQEDLPLDNQFRPPGNLDGSGVTIYVIDTGIRATHKQFEKKNGDGNRVMQRKDFSDDGDNEDMNGHGTQ